MDYQHEELIKEAIGKLATLALHTVIKSETIENNIISGSLSFRAWNMIHETIELLKRTTETTDETEQAYQEDYDGHEREG